jgi:predicted transcriptional regulator
MIGSVMADDGRVITTKLEDDLVTLLDAAAQRIGRSKSWIVRAALEQWLAEEQLRHQLTMEALVEVEGKHLIEQGAMDVWAKSLKRTVKKTPARV